MFMNLDFGVRGTALLYCGYIVFLMFLPARWIFALGGAGSCLAGVCYLGERTGPAIVGLVLGTALIALSIRTFIHERRQAARQAELSAVCVKKIVERAHRPRL